jgi:hypothetical protein
MHRAALFLLLWVLCPPGAIAGVADAPGSDLEVSLITYGPGAIYWERFGHDAIEIRDSVSGQAASFNYGVFDFDERGFLLNFARGTMHYMIDVAPSEEDQKLYIDDGRSVTRQRLALSAAQRARLRGFLLWNLLPENLHYDYDYLVDNCSTRVRDALDRALDGQLRAQLTQRPASLSYRRQIDRLMSAQPWLMILMDLGLGPFADQALSAWQESFLPMVVQRELRSVRIDDGHGARIPLVSSEESVSPNRLEPPPAVPPDLRLPLAVTGLVTAALLAGARRRAPALAATLASGFLVFAGIAGVFLLALWTLTLHRAAWANTNLLLFNPLAFALLPTVWRSRHGVRPTRVVRGMLFAQLLAAGILVHVLPPPVQQNQPWLLFALPIWGAIAWMLLVVRKPNRTRASTPAATLS